MTSRPWLAFSLAGIALLLYACAAKPPKPADTFAVLSASADVNPDADGRPSPVVVRIYQLRGDSEFSGSAFMALYDKDKETLGASLISREEQTLFPGQQMEMKLPLSPEAVFIGVYAGFRDFQSTRWRAITRAPEKSTLKVLSKLKLNVHVDKGAITVSTN